MTMSIDSSTKPDSDAKARSARNGHKPDSVPVTWAAGSEGDRRRALAARALVGVLIERRPQARPDAPEELRPTGAAGWRPLAQSQQPLDYRQNSLLSSAERAQRAREQRGVGEARKPGRKHWSSQAALRR